MPRLPFVPDDISEPADVIENMKARRGGQLNEVDRIMLHAPEFSRGFNLLMGNVRRKLNVSPFLRELAICGVGYLNHSEFEIANHVPELEKLGASEEQLEAIRDYTAAAENASLFDERQRLIMKLTIEMTQNIQVSDALFDEVRQAFPNPSDVVELIGTIASYNMVCRILVALDI